METLKQYRVLVHLEDRQGYKWGQSVSLWAYTLESANNAGKLYTEWLNSNSWGDVVAGSYAGEIVTGYNAYEMGVPQ
jgi:hypothetical protein